LAIRKRADEKHDMLCPGREILTYLAAELPDRVRADHLEWTGRARRAAALTGGPEEEGSMIHVTLFAVLLSASAASQAGGLVCDPSLHVAYPREVPAWDANRPYETIYDWAGSRSEVPLGIGHVARSGRFWWGERHVRLPLHDAPGEAPWGWFADGWLIEPGRRESRPILVGTQGMVETEYEATSFIVLAQRSDDWLRIRFGKPAGARDGTAWVHRCHLARESLAFERWEDRLLSDEISPLFFRDEAPQALFERPEDDSPQVMRIAGDYHLEPLGFEGDWMRVRVKQPSDNCNQPEGVKTYEGWVRWRSAAKGPLVWYHTRGC